MLFLEYHYPPAPCETARRRVPHFSPTLNVASADPVLDVIPNIGTVETVLTGLTAHMRDTIRVIHGLPGEGLLLPKITYRISLRHGTPADYARGFGKHLRVGSGAASKAADFVAATDRGPPENRIRRFSSLRGPQSASPILGRRPFTRLAELNGRQPFRQQRARLDFLERTRAERRKL